MNDSRDQRVLRASDADREQVAEKLREAAAEGRLSLAELDERIDALYAAKTYGELELVVEDLPGLVRLTDLRPPPDPAPIARPTAEVAATKPAAAPGRVGGIAGSPASKAVFGGIQRRGRWVVPSNYWVKVVFGGAELDLRQAQLETREVDIRIKAVFGGVVIVVPDDVQVIVDGSGIFGGFVDEAGSQDYRQGAPMVRVSGKAVFGGVSVRRKPVDRA